MKEAENTEVLAMKIRRDILKMLLHRGYGHMGGSLSIVELLAVLYGNVMKIDPKNPQWSERDYLVLSKGHAGPAVYSALANVGYFDHELLYTLNNLGTTLPSHLDRNKTPGVDATTGSLGQGTSIAAGIATGFKLAQSQKKVFLIVGDGELNEGQCWEAFQYIVHRNLKNCVVLIDYNKGQNDGKSQGIIASQDIVAKMSAFGFQASLVKGNDLEAIQEALLGAVANQGQPTCLVLDTIKGQGVPFFETYAGNHSVKFTDPEVIAVTKQAIEKLTEELAEKEGAMG